MNLVNGRSAFTVVEMLVVVLLMAVLLAILMPALAGAREAARQVQCASNLRQFGLTLVNYASQCRDVMPPGDRNIWWYLLPFSGEVALVTVMTPKGPSVGTLSSLYRCPSDFKNDFGAAGTSYAFNMTGPVGYGSSPEGNYRPQHSSYPNFVNVNLGANNKHSPFSTTYNHDLGVVNWDIGNTVRLSESAANTFLMIEHWGRCSCEWEFTRTLVPLSRTFFHISRTDGTFSALDLDKPDSGGVCKHTFHAGLRVLTHDFFVYGRARPGMSHAIYQGWKENSRGRMVEDGTWVKWPWGFQGESTFSAAFHGGHVNILHADGHVEAHSVRQVAGTPVIYEHRWTRSHD